MSMRTYFLAMIVIIANLTPSSTIAEDGPPGGYEMPPSLVVPYTIEPAEFFEEYEAVGQVKYSESQYITAKKAGTVEYVTGMQGQMVQKGKIIISLNEKMAKQALAKAEAEFASAATTYKRDFSLFKKKIISEEALSKSKVDLERSKLELVKAEDNLEDMVITAPFDGIIGVIRPRIGDEITIGDRLFTIIMPSKKEALVELPQNLRGKVDDNTVIYATDFDGKKVQGKVIAMSEYLSQSGTLTTKIEFGEDANFIHDSFIEVTVQYNRHHGLSIPEKAVLKNNTGNFVFKIKEDRSINQVYVNVGTRTGNNVELLKSEDIGQGDQIVLEGLTKVFEGAKVRFSEDEAKAEEGPKEDMEDGAESNPALTPIPDELPEEGK